MGHFRSLFLGERVMLELAGPWELAYPHWSGFVQMYMQTVVAIPVGSLPCHFLPVNVFHQVFRMKVEGTGCFSKQLPGSRFTRIFLPLQQLNMDFGVILSVSQNQGFIETTEGFLGALCLHREHPAL